MGKAGGKILQLVDDLEVVALADISEKGLATAADELGVEDIERDVETAIRTLGPGGGYIAAPVDKIEDWTPWENVEAMIAKWKELASDPM